MTIRNVAFLAMLLCILLLGVPGVSPSAEVSQSLDGAQVANSARPAVRDTNLGLATTDPSFLDGSTAAFTVSEVRQQRDLNGDGDMIDVVVHVFDASTGTVRNLRVSNRTDPTGDVPGLSFPLLEGRLFAFSVFEDSIDLNADGDVGDEVLYVYDTARRSLLNLRLAVEPQWFIFDGRHLAFRVSEALQGQRDLNRDGDADDRVLHVFDVVTRGTQNAALAVFGFASVMDSNPMDLTLDPIPFSVSEQEQGGVDLNGDGDAADWVLHVLDKGRVRNLRVAIARQDLVSGAGSVLAIVQEEIDLNGDQDVDDDVLQVVDISSGAIHNTGLVIDSPALSTVFDRDLGLALIDVLESAQGRDLNGDGMLDRRVLQAVSLRTGRVRNLQLVAFAEFAAKGRAVLVTMEPGARTDLNGDGDQDDSVVIVADLRREVPRLIYSAAVGKPVNANLFDPETFQIRGDVMTLLVSESGQGNRDLNADGDTDDAVLHFFDLNTLTSLNSRLDGSFAYRTVLAPLLPLSDGRAVVPVLESRQGNRDLNRDGDTDDVVLQIFDTKSRSTRNTGIAVALETFFPFEVPMMIRGETFVSFLTQEGTVDLNVDGDTEDWVHHLLDVATGRITNLRRAAPGPINVEDNGTFSFDFAGLTDSFEFEIEISSWLRFLGRPNTDGPGFGDAFTFVVSEAAQGNTDLNGDGDTNDTVVHATRLTDLDRNGRLDFAE